MLTAGSILASVPHLDVIRRAAGRRRCYLVGGAVRDAFLGRPSKDFDFVVDQAPVVARTVARRLGGTLVALHEEHQTSRVVVGSGAGRIDLDFAAPRRPGLLGDLRARDFTLSAIAAGPLGGQARLVDPCGGRADLAKRRVRMTGPEALAADPVRVLRAYRLAATLGFRIEAATRRQCRKLAGRVASCPRERLGAELLLLLAADTYATPLEAMGEDGVLSALLPDWAAGAGVEQGGVHEFDVAEHSLRAALELHLITVRPDTWLPEHEARIGAYLADPQRRAGLVLATLLHDVGKPQRRVWGGDRWRFFGHEELGAGLAARSTAQLGLPRGVRRQVKTLVGAHMRLLPFMQSDEPTPRARRRFMRDLAPHGVGAVLLALADRRALRSRPEFDDDEATLRRLAALLAAEDDEPGGRRHDLPITGDDLLGLGLKPGPQIGEILRAVEDRWIDGELAGRGEALEWLARRVRADDGGAAKTDADHAEG